MTFSPPICPRLPPEPQGPLPGRLLVGEETAFARPGREEGSVRCGAAWPRRPSESFKRSAAFFSGFEAVFWCTIILLVVRKTYPTALTVDAQRRVLLPCALRRALGVGPGSRLVALVEGERLVLEPWERVEGVLWEELADLKENLAEELLRERRLEAERDG